MWTTAAARQFRHAGRHLHARHAAWTRAPHAARTAAARFPPPTPLPTTLLFTAPSSTSLSASVSRGRDCCSAPWPPPPPSPCAAALFLLPLPARPLPPLSGHSRIAPLSPRAVSLLHCRAYHHAAAEDDDGGGGDGGGGDGGGGGDDDNDDPSAIKRKYAQLFEACDTDDSGAVSLAELKTTLFRFGLAGLDAPTLARVFDRCDVDKNGSLNLDSFIKFVEESADLKTAFDNQLPEGSAPLWWRKFKRELSHYRTSFSLLAEQTRSATALLWDHGWRMKRTERRLVWVAVLDFVKVLPFAALLVAPGGSVMVPLVVKYFPSFLPSTFSTDSLDKQHREKNIQKSSLEVASRILTLEKELKVALREREAHQTQLARVMARRWSRSRKASGGDHGKKEDTDAGPTRQ